MSYTLLKTSHTALHTVPTWGMKLVWTFKFSWCWRWVNARISYFSAYSYLRYHHLWCHASVAGILQAFENLPNPQCLLMVLQQIIGFSFHSCFPKSQIDNNWDPCNVAFREKYTSYLHHALLCVNTVRKVP